MKVLMQIAVTAVVDVEENLGTARVTVDHVKANTATLLCDPDRPGYKPTPSEVHDYRVIAVLYTLNQLQKEAQNAADEIGEPALTQHEGKA